MAKQHKIAMLGLEHWYWAYPIAGAVSAMQDAELTYVIGEDEGTNQKDRRADAGEALGHRLPDRFRGSSGGYCGNYAHHQPPRAGNRRG